MVLIFSCLGGIMIMYLRGCGVMNKKIDCVDALNSAIASVEIEGYKLDDEQKEFCFEFVSGNMNKDEFINLMLERCRV